MESSMKQALDRAHGGFSRRQFLKASAATVLGCAINGAPVLAAEPIDPEKLAIYRSKTMGCFMGAPIADAMGGPVECQHYKRIARYFPDFQDHIRYDTPGTFFKLNPAYALEATAGTTTDDTAIRMQLARYMIETDPPYTAAKFAPWLIENADFSNWWGQAVKAVKRVESGEVTPEEGGRTHAQGGGGGWWQPVSILHAADPDKASAMTADMCRIWKAPLEQDILSSVVAGQAAAFMKGATVDSVVQAVLADSGPLATKLFTRAVEIASEAKDPMKLYEALYEHCLVKSCTTEVDGPMPERLAPVDQFEPRGYNGILFAEQQPLALAYFVYGQGDPHKTVLTAVKGGRDADSNATNSAAWLGALIGIEGWPKKWVDTVQQANLKRIDIEKTGQDLIARGIKNGMVRFDRM
jgi:ADP-ribosylglycohydrolase